MSDWALLYLCCGLSHSISATYRLYRRMNDKTDSIKSELQQVVDDSESPFWFCGIFTAFAIVLIFTSSALIWPYLMSLKILKENHEQTTTRCNAAGA